jgi:hypothetical protein
MRSSLKSAHRVLVDRGTIVHIPPESNSWCIVECMDKDGSTIWLADFMSDELELVEAAK